MKNALILHGTNGSPKHNWFPWLKKELERKGYNVWVPNLPGADKPDIKRYNRFIFGNKKWVFNSDSVIIGHSSGSVAILGLLQKLPLNTIIDTCIFVGSFMDHLGREDLRGLFSKPFDFKKIKKQAKHFIFLHSDNDPYCPLEHAVYLSEKLGGKLIVKKGQKHFSVSTGGEKFRKLPIILELIKERGEDEILDLVNEKDEVIGKIWKSEAHKDPSKIHREVAIAVFNKNGDVLLQQRSFNKEHHPGRWAITAGHVGRGEDPQDAAKRELFEELGWKYSIKFLSKMFAQDNKESRFFWIFYIVVEEKLKADFDKNEIENIKWVDFRKIREFAKDNEYMLTGTTHKILTKVVKELGI